MSAPDLHYLRGIAAFLGVSPQTLWRLRRDGVRVVGPRDVERVTGAPIDAGPWHSVSDVARALGLSPSALDRRISRGVVRCVRVRCQRRISRVEVERLTSIVSNTVQVNPAPQGSTT